MKLIPTPKGVNETTGSLPIAALGDLRIALGSDRRITKIAAKLKGEIEAITGGQVRMKTCCCGKSMGGIHISHGSESGKAGDSYTLTVSEQGITIVGTGAPGAYYGMQTLRQLLRQELPGGSDALPFCTISDAPDFAERGFYHDVTRGRVPTLEQLCRIVDLLGLYKVNQLQLYVEDAFEFTEYDGIMRKSEMLTAEEIMQLDDYCYDNFIELVPSLSTFGHLYNLLQSEKYRHLCELPDYTPTRHYWIEKMAHHTIDVSNPESIALVKSMIDQFIPLCRSNRFNICCDETFDLCRGRNTGKDAGEEYFKFVSLIIDHVKSRGKSVMMWGDIALAHPDRIPAIPADTVMLNWYYEKEPPENRVKAFADAKLAQIVCPGTSTWNRFVENLDCSESNIVKMANYGAKYGALGVLNTNWGDYGNVCSFHCSLYGLVLGAEMSWNRDGAPTPTFEAAASSLLYDAADTNVIDLIRTMGRCESSCTWGRIVYWVSATTIEGRSIELPLDTARTIADLTTLDGVIAQLRAISKTDPRFVDLALACRGIQLVHRACLRIHHVEGYHDGEALLRDVKAWLADYEAAWLRDNKESGFRHIAEFVRALAVMDVK